MEETVKRKVTQLLTTNSLIKESLNAYSIGKNLKFLFFNKEESLSRER